MLVTLLLVITSVHGIPRNLPELSYTGKNVVRRFGSPSPLMSNVFNPPGYRAGFTTNSYAVPAGAGTFSVNRPVFSSWKSGGAAATTFSRFASGGFNGQFKSGSPFVGAQSSSFPISFDSDFGFAKGGSLFPNVVPAGSAAGSGLNSRGESGFDKANEDFLAEAVGDGGLTSGSSSQASLPNLRPNRITGLRAYQPQLPGFPELSLPGNNIDSCFPKLKALFDRAYPALPQLKPASGTFTAPSPRFAAALPPSVQPTYAYANGKGPVYVPYKLPTTNFAMYAPFDRKTRELIYPTYPLLLPYPKLAINQPRFDRQYVIYLPFQPDVSRQRQCSASDIFVPFPGRFNDFFSYNGFNPVFRSNIRNSAAAVAKPLTMGEIKPAAPMIVSQALKTFAPAPAVVKPRVDVIRPALPLIQPHVDVVAPAAPLIQPHVDVVAPAPAVIQTKADVVVPAPVIAQPHVDVVAPAPPLIKPNVAFVAPAPVVAQPHVDIVAPVAPVVAQPHVDVVAPAPAVVHSHANVIAPVAPVVAQPHVDVIAPAPAVVHPHANVIAPAPVVAQPHVDVVAPVAPVIAQPHVDVVAAPAPAVVHSHANIIAPAPIVAQPHVDVVAAPAPAVVHSHSNFVAPAPVVAQPYVDVVAAPAPVVAQPHVDVVAAPAPAVVHSRANFVAPAPVVAQSHVDVVAAPAPVVAQPHIDVVAPAPAVVHSHANIVAPAPVVAQPHIDVVAPAPVVIHSHSNVAPAPVPAQSHVDVLPNAAIGTRAFGNIVPVPISIQNSVGPASGNVIYAGPSESFIPASTGFQNGGIGALSPVALPASAGTISNVGVTKVGQY